MFAAKAIEAVKSRLPKVIAFYKGHKKFCAVVACTLVVLALLV